MQLRDVFKINTIVRNGYFGHRSRRWRSARTSLETSQQISPRGRHLLLFFEPHQYGRKGRNKLDHSRRWIPLQLGSDLAAYRKGFVPDLFRKPK
jgi:hypothetical protein